MTTVHGQYICSGNDNSETLAVAIILGSLDFLLALIELFSLGVTAEALRAIIGWKSSISL